LNQKAHLNILHFLDKSHVNKLRSHHIFLSSICEGRKLCLMFKWDAGEALRLIESERATAWTGVPTMVQDMINHPDFASRDTSSLKSIGGGGAPTPPANVAKINTKFKGRPSNGYGQ
jgi:long-chain acyl-CoA synthetase